MTITTLFKNWTWSTLVNHWCFSLFCDSFDSNNPSILESYRAQDQQQCIVFLFLFYFSMIFSCEMGTVTAADLAGTKLWQLIPAVGDQPAWWLLHPFHGCALGPPPPSLLLHSVLCWVVACCRWVQDHVLRPQSGSAAQLSSAQGSL